MGIMTSRIRSGYLIAMALVIPVGFMSRKVAFLPHSLGDALWAVMVFCCLRMFFCRISLDKVAVAALAISFADELFQLVQWPWLNEVRETAVGHLILGQGFRWNDMLAYILGIGTAWLIARIFEAP